MPDTTPQPPRRRPILVRMAHGSGAAVRHTLDAMTWPLRTVRRVLGRGGARGPEEGIAVLRRQRLDLSEVRRRGAADARASFEAAHIAADEGLSALSETLSDADPAVRMLAIDVVSELSGERAARLLGAVLHDPDPTVRRAAALAAGRLRASGTVFSLILAVEDPSADVRAAAARAIEDITGRPVSTEGSAAMRERAVRELKKWWKERRYAELAAERRLVPSP